MTRSVMMLFIIAACQIPFAPNQASTPNLKRMHVPGIYSEWYAVTARCYGVDGDFQSIAWFTADEIVLNGVSAKGLQRGNMIIIRTDMVMDQQTVRHEASHHSTGLGDEIHLDGGARTRCDGT